MRRGNSRGGFAMVELVVAMSIIFIISAVAVGVIKTQSDFYRLTAQTVEATNMAENAIECFRYTDNADEFDSMFGKTGVTTDRISYDNDTRTVFTFERSEMNVEIEIKPNLTDGGEIVSYTLTFVARDINSNGVILEQSYTK